LFFGLADLATQRRLTERSTVGSTQEQRRDEALAKIERYATEEQCRHQTLVSHFTGQDDEPVCGQCDVCLGTVAAQEVDQSRGRSGVVVESLPSEALDKIVSAVDRLSRPVGRRNLAQALRGGKAKTLSRGGLLTIPEYGQLSEHSEDSVIAAIDGLLGEGRLQRTGKKYPTVWIPGKPVRTMHVSRGSSKAAAEGDGGGWDSSSTSRSTPRRKPQSRYGGDIARALDNYRKRTARKLGWKTYMVFQRRVLLAIDREEPDSIEALSRISGLGPAKIERFGEDLLGMVREHRRRRMDD
jgi:ATP-dependent DNA helicase RecQ